MSLSSLSAVHAKQHQHVSPQQVTDNALLDFPLLDPLRLRLREAASRSQSMATLGSTSVTGSQ